MTKANGKEDFGVTSLCRKREEIVSLIGAKEIELNTLVIQLGHIDASLKILRPEIALTGLPERPDPRPVRSKRGENSRPVLHALHTAQGALTVKDIARAMLIAQGRPAQRISSGSREVVRQVLRDLKRRGVVRPLGLDGPAQTWVLVRED